MLCAGSAARGAGRHAAMIGPEGLVSATGNGRGGGGEADGHGAMTAEVKLACEGVWKLFGPEPERFLARASRARRPRSSPPPG